MFGVFKVFLVIFVQYSYGSFICYVIFFSGIQETLRSGTLGVWGLFGVLGFVHLRSDSSSDSLISSLYNILRFFEPKDTKDSKH